MVCGGLQGFQEVLDMNNIVKAVNSKARILVTSIEDASYVTHLASQVGKSPQLCQPAAWPLSGGKGGPQMSNTQSM